MSDDIRLPQLLPVLSRGKHRNPRKGACFMELASFLAGERWSDHPACTHPLLAALARHGLDPGARADVVLLDAENVPDALVRAPARRTVIAGGRLVVSAGELHSPRRLHAS